MLVRYMRQYTEKSKTYRLDSPSYFGGQIIGLKFSG